MTNGIDFIGSSQQTLFKAAGASGKVRLAKGDKPLMEACEQFESIFIKQMLNTMRKTVEKSGLLDGGMTENIFEDWLYDQYSEKMAKNADFGLAKQMFNQMKAADSYSRNLMD